MSKWKFGLVLAIGVTVAPPVMASRIVYMAPLRQRAEQTKLEPVKGSAMRIWVSLHNLSNVAQSLTVIATPLPTVEEVAFNGFPATAALSAWTLNSVVSIRYRTVNMPVQTRTFSLPANASGEANFSFACIFNNSMSSPNCANNETALAMASTIPDTVGGAYTGAVRLSVEVAEDRGAIIGDALIQMVLAGTTVNPTVQATRGFNGGRAF